MSGQRLEPPAAVLFDLDGLLVDSEPLWTIAEQRVAEGLGGVFTPHLKAGMIGKRLDLAVGILLDGLDTPQARAADPAAIGQRLLDEMVTLLAAGAPVQPGAEKLLDELAAAGVPLAVVSSSYRRLVDAALTSVGPSRFKVSVAGDEVTHGKPDPEPYLTAARALQAVPARCVVLEDAPAGLTSALAAGCACVYVPTFPTHDPLPDRVEARANLTDVDLDLLSRLSVHPETPGHRESRKPRG
jgi:HAD superfamily hydrolase (TIGR01509 family)